MACHWPLMTVGLVLAVACPSGGQTTPTPHIYWTEPSTGWIKRLEAYNPQAPPENVAEGRGARRGIACVAARHALFFADSTFGDIIELSYLTGQGNVIYDGTGSPGGLTGTPIPTPTTPCSFSGTRTARSGGRTWT